MNLLTVDEVTKIWRCRRITVLRLMRSGSLHWIEEEGEPLFDEAEVLALKNPKIAVFPHLTISAGSRLELPKSRIEVARGGFDGIGRQRWNPKQ